MTLQTCKPTDRLTKGPWRSLFFLACPLFLLSPFPLSLAIALPIPLPSLHPSPILMQVMTMPLPDALFQRWIHSREEDQGDIRVYRPTHYAFPPARGRDGLEFRPNGEFIRYPIGASDRSMAVPGQWTSLDSDSMTIQLVESTRPSSQLTILECDDQILKIRTRQT